MRFLGIGDSCDLLALYRQLQEDGHEVRVDIGDPACRGTGEGLIGLTADWRNELWWIQEAGHDGIIIFENVARERGREQDALRSEGFNVIGGSAFGDRLENDRAYAQSILADLGLQICGVHEFDRGEDALSFLDDHPGRYVLKFNGQAFASADNYVGRLQDGRDVRALLAAKLEATGRTDASFILMDHVEGIEMGVGAYFNGENFLEPACLDWEHKRFFPGDLGELTGEMGTVVTYGRSRRFFDMTLARIAPLLRQHRYCGYINLNTIVNEQGIWPLEFTCRFGYPGFAILAPLQSDGWASLFSAMTRRTQTRFRTKPGFCLGLVVTTPPFPYTRKQVAEAIGLPVLFSGDTTPEDGRHLHFGEVGLSGSRLVTSGIYGWTMVVTGLGPDIETARNAAYARAQKIFVPNMRYRADIGLRLIGGELAAVEKLGLLDPF